MRGARSLYLDGKSSKLVLPQSGDEIVGGWPRERLIAMNERFVERAFENGGERRHGADALRPLSKTETGRSIQFVSNRDKFISRLSP